MQTKTLLVLKAPYHVLKYSMTMFVATVIALGHLAGIIGAPLMFVSFWIKLAYEEKLMLGQFPDQYAVYQQHVKRIIRAT